MAPVGRPRTTTRQGSRAPTSEIGVPDLGLGGWGVTGSQSPLVGGTGPWRMYVDEWEYVPELRWPMSTTLFDQMRTDSQLAGLLTAVMWGICQLRFVIDPNGARESLIKEVSEDLNLPIMGKDDQPVGRMKRRFSHRKHAVQAMLSAIYGHMYFEQVGEIVDGKWRLRKLAPRMPQTIRQINVADDGGLVSIVQWAPVGWNFQNNSPGALFGPEIPVDRLTAFIFQQEGMSWSGRSMMRDCYKDWLIKDRDLRLESINHERAGGVPYAVGAMGMTTDELQDLNSMMQQFRLGETAGAALPYGTELKIAKGTGSDIDNTIKRIDESMARRFLLQLVNLAQGGQHVGSYSLSETFEDFFLVGQRHIAQWYCDTMTEHVIEDIVDWNYGEDEELTPRITWERTSEDSLGTEQLALMVQRGIITMDDELENWVRYRNLMPKKTSPRPEDITPGGPRQPTEEQFQKDPSLSTGKEAAPAAPAPTKAAGMEERVLPPAEIPADVRASFWDRIARRKPDVRAAWEDDLLLVVTAKDVPILHAGVEYKLSTGPTTFTPEDLRDVVTAANEDPSIPNPRLGLGHIDPRFDNDKLFDGEPAFGIAKNLRLSENCMEVLADYAGVPAWLAPILPYAYPNRSIEGYWNVESYTGKKWRFVLSSCKLLGVKWPGITVLEDLPMMYGDQVPEGVVIDDSIVEAVAANATGGDPDVKFPFRREATSAMANLDDVRRAFYQEYCPANQASDNWWVQAVLTDPNELIVEDYESGQLYKMPFSSDSSGNVTFSEAEAVRIDYVPDNRDAVKAAAPHVAAMLAAGRTVLASWSTREESVLPTTATGGAMDPKEIRKRLGLPEDASDEQVQENLRSLNEAAGLKLETEVPAPVVSTTEKPVVVETPVVTPPVAEAPAQVAAKGLELPEGVVLMDKATLDELRSNGAAAATLVQEHRQSRREQMVSAAIADGRIAPARKDHWHKALEADEEGASAVLASLAPGLVPLEERGHGHAPEGGNGAQLEQEVVQDWTQTLFPETREHYARMAAAASGETLGTRRSRVVSDAHYTR